ncbi:MAG: hypothetical protein H6625_02015 [Bdellovibrionaceae bacterium]|nr:hypothetical protein [Pseudobdellovibrionaceae bacterium]
MHKIIFYLFLTLVIKNPYIFANPHQDIHPAKESNSEESTEKTKTINIDDENLILSRPIEPQNLKTTDEFYPYTQAISPRIGTLVNLHEFRDNIGQAFHTVYGFSYLLPRNHSPQLEIGADVIKDFNGQFHASKRWIINERSSFRPFYKLGLTIIAIGKEGLATFANSENYLAHASIGLEDYYKRPMSLRWELELSGGKEYFFLILSFGYSWGF